MNIFSLSIYKFLSFAATKLLIISDMHEYFFNYFTKIAGNLQFVS